MITLTEILTRLSQPCY